MAIDPRQISRAAVTESAQWAALRALKVPVAVWRASEPKQLADVNDAFLQVFGDKASPTVEAAVFGESVHSPDLPPANFEVGDERVVRIYTRNKGWSRFLISVSAGSSGQERVLVFQEQRSTGSFHRKGIDELFHHVSIPAREYDLKAAMTLMENKRLAGVQLEKTYTKDKKAIKELVDCLELAGINRACIEFFHRLNNERDKYQFEYVEKDNHLYLGGRMLLNAFEGKPFGPEPIMVVDYDGNLIQFFISSIVLRNHDGDVSSLIVFYDDRVEGQSEFDTSRSALNPLELPIPVAQLDTTHLIEELERRGIRDAQQALEMLEGDIGLCIELNKLMPVVEGNAAFQAFMQRLPQGFRAVDFGTEDHARRLARNIACILGGDWPQSNMIELIDHHGNLVRARQHVRGERDKNGRIQLLTLALVDVTNEFNAIDQASEVLKLYETLFENAPIGLLEIDMATIAQDHYRRFGDDLEAGVSAIGSEGVNLGLLKQSKVLRLNGQAKEVYRSSDMADVMSAALDSGGAAQKERLTKAYLNLTDSGIDNASDFEILSASGQVKTIKASSAVVDKIGPWPSRLIYSVIDVSEQARAYRELEQLSRDLERIVAEKTRGLSELNQKLEAYAYSISHDLRSPLRSLSMILRTLEEDGGELVPTHIREQIKDAAVKAEQLGEMTKALLDLSALGRHGLKRREVDMLRVVDAAWRMATLETRDDIHLETHELVSAWADQDLMVMLWRNLLENSIKFMVPGRKPKIVAGSVQTEGRRWWYVLDNGRGIDPGWSERIFEPFRRMPEQQATSGIGVGLATVKSIVEHHGGQILAEAQPSGGTKISFWLPSREEVESE